MSGVPTDLGELLELALDAIPELVIIKGDRSRLLWVNRAVREIYGMSNAELKDAVDGPQVDVDDTSQYVRDDHHVFTTGEILEIPIEHVTDLNGVSTPVRTIKAPIRKDGDIVATVGVSHAIEDNADYRLWLEERAERKGRRAELASFVRHLPSAVAMFDRSLYLLTCSDQWKHAFGVEFDASSFETYERRHEDILPIAAALRQAVDEGERNSLLSVPMAGGRIVSVHIAPWVIGEMRGGTQAAGLLVEVVDETERLRAAQKLQELNDELAQFNYRVSHDLVAPLRTIKGFIELSGYALNDGDTAEAASLHARMDEQVDHLSDMVRDLMSLARADVDAEIEDIDLSALVDEVREVHSSDLEACEGTLRVQLETPTWSTQRVRVRQILDNLIGNAIKYRRAESSPEILIRVARDGHENVMTVTDDGIGFHPDQAESIFELFTRGTTTRSGSGLGLAIARKHATRLDGKIRAWRDGGLTHFELRLPGA